MFPNNLTIPKQLWSQLIIDLRKRGKRRRESGAFLLAKPETREVIDYRCYDDLDPQTYYTGIIVFRSLGYRPLWDYCRDNGLTVIADVHTHPSGWTGQSSSDKAHPMIVQQGHISLIVPRFAQRNKRNTKGVGYYEYLGDLKWKTYDINEKLKLS